MSLSPHSPFQQVRILSLSLFHLPYTYQLLNIIEKNLRYSFGEVLGEIGGAGGSSVPVLLSFG